MPKICAECGKENRDAAKFCNGCGYKFPDATGQKGSTKDKDNAPTKNKVSLKKLTEYMISGNITAIKEHEANGDLKNAVYEQKRTPLHIAAQLGVIEIIKLFVKNQHDTNTKDNFGSTPLLTALEFGHIKAAEYLIEQKSDINIQDNTGISPVDLAIRLQDVNLVEKLLSKGAKVNVSDKIGWTPLHRASFLGNKKITELLIANDADINKKDNNNITPLAYAEQEGHKDVEKYLKSLKK